MQRGNLEKNTMQIEIKELASLLNGEPKTNRADSACASYGLGQQIVVLDRGFVYVGDVFHEGDFLRITNARNIRIWGTKNGLGELADGPTESTKLDKVGEVLAPMKSVIHFIKCNRNW